MQSYPSPGAIAGDSGNQPFYSSASTQQQSGLQNPDDLQISTQLSGLTPIMNAGAGPSMSDGRDPRGQDHNDMNHQYAQQVTNAHPQVHHSPIDQVGGRYGTPDGSAQKQRSKVSRACDECRRKKIKCNASDDPSDPHCKSCRRVGLMCQWSRQQLKRGPSKGYIKELADRVNSLENQIQHSPGTNQPQYFSHPASPAQRRPSDDFSPDPSGQNFAKRRRTSATPIEDNQYRGLLLSQRPGWVPQEAPRHAHTGLSSAFTSPQLAISTPVLRDTHYSPNALQTENLRHASESLTQHGNSLDNMSRLPTFTQRVYELDDGVLDSYYFSIQPTYPLLPEDRTKLHMRLSAIPSYLREAFCECIHAAVRSFPTSSQPPLERATSRKGAQHMLLAGIDASRPVAENIVYLQCLLLLAIEGGNLVVAQPGQKNLDQSVWLHHAVGLALAMKLPVRQQETSTDFDSDDNTLRRIWWTLAIVDRFVAATMSTHYIIPEEALVLRREDQLILGEGVWNMARLATTLGHYSMVNSSPEAPFDVPMGRRLSNELDRCRETFPTNFYPDSNEYKPLYHMIYWHLKILVSIETNDFEPSELLQIAYCALESMKKTPEFISPLKYQCAMVIVLTLIELRGYDKTKDHAEAALSDSLTAVGIAHWGNLIDGLIAKYNKYQTPVVSAEGDHTSLDSQRLQRLADLATAREDGREVAQTDKETELDSISAAPASVPLPRYAFIKDVLRKGSLSPLLENLI